MHSRITIFGVRYSPNLGDGIISDCLKHLVEEASVSKHKNLEVQAFDLAARTAFSNDKIEPRAKLISLLSKLPSFVRQVIIGSYLLLNYLRRFGPYYERVISKSDLVIIGGGQILSDTDLNFPIKIYGLTRKIIRRKISVCFSACGAANNWGVIGQVLFNRSFSSPTVKYIGCRDEQSLTTMSTYLSETAKRHLHHQPDPALFVQETYSVKRSVNKQLNVGIGFASFNNMKYSGEGTSFTQEGWFKLISTLIRDLNMSDISVFLFTNGAAEDEKCLDSFESYILSKGLALNYKRIARPQTPKDLVTTISKADCILAYRLHASITSFGLDIPSIGFYWDDKISSFYQQINRERFCIRSTQMRAQELSDLIFEAINIGVDSSLLLQLKGELKTTIDEMLHMALETSESISLNSKRAEASKLMGLG